MRMDFSHNNKLKAKNKFNLFYYIVSKEIFCKGVKVKGLDHKTDKQILKVCDNFRRGYSMELPKNVEEYLSKKLKESEELYNDFLEMYKDGNILNVKLF